MGHAAKTKPGTTPFTRENMTAESLLEITEMEIYQILVERNGNAPGWLQGHNAISTGILNRCFL
jgi:hypothetical protein